MKPGTAYFMLSFASLAWAGNVVIGRAVAVDMPPVGLSFWRWALALAVLLPLSWPHLRTGLPILKRELPYLATLAVIGMAAFHSLLYYAVHTTTAVNALLIMAITPAVIPLMSRLVWGERLTARQAAGIAVSMVGVVVIVCRADIEILFNLQLTHGDAVMLVAMVLWAGYSTLVRRKPAGLHPNAMLTGTVFLATLFLLPALVVEHASGAVMPLTWESVIVVAYVGIVASVLVYLGFNPAVQVVGPNKAGLFMHLMPVFGTILAIVFLDESLRAYHLSGAALIAAGLWLTTADPASATASSRTT